MNNVVSEQAAQQPTIETGLIQQSETTADRPLPRITHCSHRIQKLPPWRGIRKTGT